MIGVRSWAENFQSRLYTFSGDRITISGSYNNLSGDRILERDHILFDRKLILVQTISKI